MYNTLSVEELEEKSFHEVKVDNILKVCDPFGCWMELETPITRIEIEKCLNDGEESLENTPLIILKSEVVNLASARDRHIKKIAYFVKNGFSDPILIDVGTPEFGNYVSHIVEDGNHRLVASIIRGEENIKVKLSGSEEYAKSLKLWSPNKFQKILNEMEE